MKTIHIGRENVVARIRRRQSLVLALIVASLALSACSGADSADSWEPEVAEVTQPELVVSSPTATTPPTATATPTVAPPTATVQPQATATPTSTPTAVPTNTPAPTAEPTATATPDPTATPTPQPIEVSLPSGGAKIGVLGEPIRSIVPGDDHGEILYAVTSDGIARSGNGGRSWMTSGTVPEGVMVAALNQPDVLYAGDEGACARGDGGAPLVRSVDGGKTWQEFPEGHGVQPLLVEADWNSTIIGTNCNLQVSFNGGQEFAAINDVANYDVYAAASSNPDALDGEIVVLGVSEGGTGGLFKYGVGDSGLDLAGQLAEFYAIGAVDWSGGRIVLATPSAVGVSDDGGATWTWSRAGLEDATYSTNPLEEEIPEGERDKGYSFAVVRIHPEDPNRIWIGGSHGAFWSDDAGQTWRRLGDIMNVESIVVSTISDRVYVSGDNATRVWTLDGE